METTALVSSPLLLSDIDHPEQTIFVISGVERDTISLPRFTGEDDLIQFSREMDTLLPRLLQSENLSQGAVR